MRNSTFFELLCYKTGANLRTEIARYHLNYLWWALEPVLTMSVFYVIFDIMLNRGTEHFVAFLLTGLIWWNWFARSVQNAASSILNARVLILQVDIRKVFFPLEVCLQDGFKQLFVTVLLLAFLLVYPTPVTLTWLALPAIMVVQFLLILGVATLGAALVPFLPDLKFVIVTGVQLLFFGSGIFFRIEDVVLPEHRFIMYLNPVAGLIKNYREILINGAWPDWFYLAKVALFSLTLCFFAFWLVRKLDRTYPWVCNQ
jgi:lipopolysaccharide transport system permease protein